MILKEGVAGRGINQPGVVKPGLTGPGLKSGQYYGYSHPLPSIKRNMRFVVLHQQKAYGLLEKDILTFNLFLPSFATDEKKTLLH